MRSIILARKSVTIGSLLALALAAGPVLHGGQEATPVVAAQEKIGQSVSDIHGQNVLSTSGQELGKLEDLAVNTRGRVAYALVSSGSQTGNEVHVIPFSAIERNRDDRTLMVDLRGKSWNAAPKLRSTDLADLATNERAREIHRFFGLDWSNTQSEGKSQSPGDNRLIRVSSITEKKVQNKREYIGVIDDVIINFDQSRASVVIDPHDSFFDSDKKFAISFGQLDFSRSNNDLLTATLTRADFNQAHPTPTDSSKAISESDYPYVWGHTPVRGDSDTPTAGSNPAATTTAQEADEPSGKLSLADIRGRLDGHRALMEGADNIEITRDGDRLVISGSVPMATLKTEIEKTIRQMADGWELENQISVQRAAE